VVKALVNLLADVGADYWFREIPKLLADWKSVRERRGLVLRRPRTIKAWREVIFFRRAGSSDNRKPAIAARSPKAMGLVELTLSDGWENRTVSSAVRLEPPIVHGPDRGVLLSLA
jgi:hypothetical protein